MSATTIPPTSADQHMKYGPTVDNVVTDLMVDVPEKSEIKLSVLQREAFIQRYAASDLATGKILELKPEEMFARVATKLSHVDGYYNPELSERELREKTKEYYDVMKSFKFIPGGRTLANMGRKNCSVVSNCVVLHQRDTMFGEKSIMETLNDEVKLQRAGCGIGRPLHTLRPHNWRCKTSGSTSSGPVSFMLSFGNFFKVIKQNTRHGANMGCMKVTHPEILEFIRCKENELSLPCFNISVSFTDEFMKRATDVNHPQYNKPWMCEFDGIDELPFFIVHEEDLTRDTNYKVVDTVWGDDPELLELKPGSHYTPGWSAARIFEEFATYSHKNGEPGCLFYDTINRFNHLPGFGKLEACNPCGEQQLHDGDVCNLGSMNLSKYGETDEKNHRVVNYKKIQKDAKIAVRILDNVIDVTDFPSERVQTTIRKNRRIGLGIMGLTDLLFFLRIPYNSVEGRKVAKRCMQSIQDAAEEETKRIAEKRGVFPNFHLSIYSKDYKGDGVPRRNTALTNIAPTGTTGLFAGICGGCEPYFKLSYSYRNALQTNNKDEVKIKQAMIESMQQTIYEEDKKTAEIMKGKISLDSMRVVGLHQQLLEALHEHCQEVLQNEKIMQEIIATGRLQHIPEIPDVVKRVFVTSSEIDIYDHIAMQAELQKVCDNAISKTLNMPNSATVEDVLSAYTSAWKNGIKGCTIYRDGSRVYQVLNANDSTNKNVECIDKNKIFDCTTLPPAHNLPPMTSEHDDHDIYVKVDRNTYPLLKSILDTISEQERYFIAKFARKKLRPRVSKTTTRPKSPLRTVTTTSNSARSSSQKSDLRCSDDGQGFCVRGGGCD